MPKRVIRGKDVVKGQRNPKEFSKKSMGVTEVKKK